MCVCVCVWCICSDRLRLSPVSVESLGAVNSVLGCVGVCGGILGVKCPPDGSSWVLTPPPPPCSPSAGGVQASGSSDPSSLDSTSEDKEENLFGLSRLCVCVCVCVCVCLEEIFSVVRKSPVLVWDLLRWSSFCIRLTSMNLFILMIDFLHKLTDLFDVWWKQWQCSQCLFSPNINCIKLNSFMFNSKIKSNYSK